MNSGTGKSAHPTSLLVVVLMLTLPVLSPTSCDGCGLCCEGIGSPVLLYASRPGFGVPHPYRPVGLPEALVEEIDSHFSGLTRGQEPLARCLWFDTATRQCRHYELRPQICREYELAGPSCLIRRQEALDNTEDFPARAAWDATIPDGG